MACSCNILLHNLAALAEYMILTSLLSRLFSRSPGMPVADLLQRGYQMQQAGDAAGAERNYRDALKIEAGNADAHYLLGALLG